jgi:hypothetical protein
MRALAAVGWLMFAAAAIARGASPSPAAIPPLLEDWRAWVLKGQEFHRCPFLAGSAPTDADSYRCVWPQPLLLSVDAHGGTFSQRWQVYTDSWVGLPGDLTRWPQGVLVDQRPAAVVARDNVPSVRLAAGTHVLSGRFSWQARPETLAVPEATALLALTVDGRALQRPELAGAVVSLGRQSSAAEPRTLEVQVYRLIEDDIPLRLLTRVRLRAAGDAREELVAGALPPGFIPVSLTGGLPARLEADGRLRVQVRAGDFTLTLDARQAQPAAALALPGEAAARDEVWSFAADDRLRVAIAEGVPGIDPAQAEVPEDWRGYPAFRMQPGAPLVIVERSRGLTQTDQNRLHLLRRLWLDFDHQGFTAVDELSGTLRHDWRLAMRAPYELASVSRGSESLLVTSQAQARETGVEVRSPEIQLTTVARTAHPLAALPATGWTIPFEAAAGELYLPPGHRLLAVIGADESPTAWLEGWGPWSLFGVLVVVVFAYWVAGPACAALALLALLLTYQAAPGLIWGWANLLAAMALVRAALRGRLALAAGAYRAASFVLLALILLPFVTGEVSESLYPQLEASTHPAQRQPMALAGALRKAIRLRPAAPPALPADAPLESAHELLEDKVQQAQLSPPSFMGGFGTSAVTVTAARRTAESPAPAMTRYAAGTLIQTGPGRPAWSYSVHPFSWSGPVEPEQTLRFLILGPVSVALWRIGGVVLLVGWFAWLLRRARDARAELPRGRPPGGALAALLLACVTAGACHGVRAAVTPDEALLTELRERLTEAPPCAPTCAEIMQAQVHLSGDRLQVVLQASALSALAIPVPSGGDHWRIEAVTVDGASSLAMAREPDEALWVPLQSGVRTVRLDGSLVGDSVQLTFPLAPRTISVAATGWDTTGVSAGRLVSGALVLTRQRHGRGPPGAADSAAGEVFAPFVRITRNFNLDLDWSVSTTVTRVAPQATAFTVAIPLVTGESVLTEGLDVGGAGVALVGLRGGQDERQWTSSLARRDTLVLRVTATPARSEVWRFLISPQWRVQFRGPPAILPEARGGSPWVFEYHPQVGEQLELTVTRPQAVPGATLAIDAVRERVLPGRRASDYELELRYRSTAGGRHTIALPKEGRVRSVTVDGEPSQLRPEAGELPLSILPGEHTIDIQWQTRDPEALAARAGVLDLRTPASNLTTEISLPGDRWPLLAMGAGVGPVLRYWGELLLFVVLVSLLGRSPHSPLRRSEWLLLGAGLSSLSWTVLLVVALWLLAVRWRARWGGAGRIPHWQFNLLQCVLVMLTVLAVSSLVFTGVRYGLLATPDMGVAGPGSNAHTFSWFADRANGVLPRPVVYSVPLWVYRVLMFVWASWVAMALTKWLPRAWRACSSGGFWRAAPPEDRGRPAVPAETPA